MNTMEDLRREVASRMRASLHGREIDMVEQVTPELPHMLGITPLNKIHDPKNEEMTLLDPQHHFWQQYEDDPMEKVRVDLPDQSTYNVSFYGKGKVTVHGRNIPPETQVDVLRYITNEVVSNLKISSFQKKLGGNYQ